MKRPPPIAKTFPKKGNMQQYRMEQLLEFTCSRCAQTKKSKLAVVLDDDWDKLLCNGCYGLLLSQQK